MHVFRVIKHKMRISLHLINQLSFNTIYNIIFTIEKYNFVIDFTPDNNKLDIFL